MSTFACHCGGTITGTSAPDANRNDQPTWTFICNDHHRAGERTLLIVNVMGTPNDEEARMATMKQAIDLNEQWYLDNPTPNDADITSTLVL